MKNIRFYASSWIAWVWPRTTDIFDVRVDGRLAGYVACDETGWHLYLGRGTIGTPLFAATAREARRRTRMILRKE